MRQPVRAALLAIAALLLLASALAHAFLGWPHLHEDLVRDGASRGLIGALSVGWHFGSVCMAAFGLIALAAAVDAWRARPVAAAPLWIVAFAYAAFGLAAFALRGHNHHFLGFVFIGALLATAAALRR